MATYLYLASECPAVQVPLSALYVGADPPTPTTGDSITAGSSASTNALPTKFNRNALRADIAGRYGMGAYAVLWGLTLSAGSGLTLRVANGQAALDGPVDVKDDAGYETLALTDNVVNRVWLSRGGTLNKVTAASASPLDPPDALVPWAYLGAVACAGGSIVGFDLSGVLSLLQGNLLWRRTADAGEPDDTPAAGVRFLTRTAGGLYLWDGLQYDRIDSDVADALESVTTLRGEFEASERRWRRFLFNAVTVTGLGELAAGIEDDFARAAGEAG